MRPDGEFAVVDDEFGDVDEDAGDAELPGEPRDDVLHELDNALPVE